ncbi:MAG TPA: hypothetical protein VGR74_13610, partial [Actinomycetota bacterium]|nr:hypothetical protein [Actinomycetota bacterium]
MTTSSTRPALRLCILAGAWLGAAGAARGDEAHFAVVDISANRTGLHEKVTTELEAEVARLRAGARPLPDSDGAMRRLLATGEGPVSAANRLTWEARAREQENDCPGAVARAVQAEAITLASVPLDDERELLRTQYAVLVGCYHALGKGSERDLAATRLRAL